MAEANAKWFTTMQRLLPAHQLSRLAGRLAEATTPWLKQQLIRAFANYYGVELADAARGRFDDYRSFNDFFTRELKPGARPLPTDDDAIICPVDGTVSQSGRIANGQLLQAKGWRYSCAALAHELADGFAGGSFATFYLAPKDYHRVHCPSSGVLSAAKAIPGALFSVNSATETEVEGLFCRNERLACRLRTAKGNLLIVLVGALIVASIEVPWPGPRSPYQASELCTPNTSLARGDELGRFLLGSTVILCVPPHSCRLADLQPGQSVRMGEAVGRWGPG